MLELFGIEPERNTETHCEMFIFRYLRNKLNNFHIFITANFSLLAVFYSYFNPAGSVNLFTVY